MRVVVVELLLDLIFDTQEFCLVDRGLISEVKPLLDALINQAGFWVAAPLCISVL